MVVGGVLPAPAGMVPTYAVDHVYVGRAPRARGDGPLADIVIGQGN
ncbi:hypothetical protein [Streptomyces sp. NPDC001675]